MRHKIRQAFKHPLISGSAIVITGNLAANFLNFLFNLFMKRSLSEAEYGVLATLISIISLPALLGVAIIPLVVRYASEFFGSGQIHMVRGLYIKIIRFFLVVNVVLFIVLLLFIPKLDAFFHISDSRVLFVTDIIIFLGLLGVINQAFIQAKLAFLAQSFITVIGSLAKLLFGVLFVSSGLAALGGALGLLVASAIGYGISFLPLRFVFDRKMSSPKINSKELFEYGIPTSLQLIGLTSLISSDIILVKHFFSPSLAGIYAGLSLIGRVIFYLTAPIGTVMFPVIVQKLSKKENITNTFLSSLGLILIPSIAVTIFYFLFPSFTILFFTGKKEDLVIVPFLGLFGVFISLYSVLNILGNFYLSIKKTKTFIPILIGAVTQIFLILLFHKSFEQIIFISTAVTLLLVIVLLLYYPYATKKR